MTSTPLIFASKNMAPAIAVPLQIPKVPAYHLVNCVVQRFHRREIFRINHPLSFDVHRQAPPQQAEK